MEAIRAAQSKASQSLCGITEWISPRMFCSGSCHICIVAFWISFFCNSLFVDVLFFFSSLRLCKVKVEESKCQTSLPEPHHSQGVVRAHLGGLLEVGAGPVAELGSGCCWLPGERPFDRWDRSAASETRSAGSCGGDGSAAGQSHQTTRATSSTMTSWCSSGHIRRIILNHLQANLLSQFYSLKSLQNHNQMQISVSLWRSWRWVRWVSLYKHRTTCYH